MKQSSIAILGCGVAAAFGVFTINSVMMDVSTEQITITGDARKAEWGADQRWVIIQTDKGPYRVSGSTVLTDVRDVAGAEVADSLTQGVTYCAVTEEGGLIELIERWLYAADDAVDRMPNITVIQEKPNNGRDCSGRVDFSALRPSHQHLGAAPSPRAALNAA